MAEPASLGDLRRRVASMLYATRSVEGLTQDTVGEALGVGGSMVTSLESGKKDLSPKHLPTLRILMPTLDMDELEVALAEIAALRLQEDCLVKVQKAKEHAAAVRARLESRQAKRPRRRDG